MSGYYKAYKAGKFVVDKIVDAFKPRGMKVPKETISNVKGKYNIGNIDKMKNKAAKSKVEASTFEANQASKEFKDKAKKVFKTVEKKADGGRIGRKFGGGTDLKDIPAGKKYAGLKKLPKEVRNKMKFKKKGGKI